ncbi:C2H2 and C2HC zinc finger [Glarea lozoyensis ATCC 20868]|uniref:C2H2 and C2HC zinc finger n=1 Tax=Glarea lozoyensis (strain ATCC 20868 / MF5171) TaxID=1116229 RepID=S3DCN5_GLAL2|nr:C2H2 and C2HC zinc finger [Glarea lozoyensis ATCC 20868]EPE35495.1 C2H2 and C2HC zinc finger [Glarea lozoyensis ATCC 20868]
MDDFNSSDIEISPVRNRYAHLAKKSLASMKDSCFDDRVSSKKRLAKLEDVRGAPSSQYKRHIWRNRFANYVAVHGLSIDPTNGPDGVNLARFTDIIVNHISGREIDSPAPLQRTLKAGIRVLISSLTFDYPKFALTRNERARLDAVFDTLADEGKLVRGRARKELHWVGTYLVEKMVRAWFQNAIDNGYRSWDIVVHKALSVVLQSALACRAGEICRSKGYETEYMQWSDIVMTLPPGWTTIDDVQVSCLLRYEKNQKREKNTYREVPLTVLRAPELNIICAVKLLLIQALRSGNILSLDHAFDQASRRVDNTVQWIFPNRPVIPSLHISSGFILWDSSNGTNSLNQTTKELGLNAGILADIRSHDIRRGAFRDLATIKRAPDAPPLGVASTEVAVIGGHSIKSLQSGVTDAYVGGVEHESYSSRAEQLPVSRKTAIVGKAYKRKRVQGHEIDDYCLENNLDATKGSERVKAGRRLKSSRAAAFIESERNADKTPSKSHTMSSPRLLMLPTPTASAPKPTSESPSSSVGNTLESLIDPRLTSYGNQDGVDVDVETDAAVSTLSALVYGDDEAIGEDEEILGMDILLECAARSDSSAQKSLLELDGRAFVEALSKINIFRNSNIEGRSAATDHQLLSVLCPTGNSRDAPTPHVFHCGFCKNYSSIVEDGLRQHQVACTLEKPMTKKERTISCHYKGCDTKVSSQKSLQSHILKYHNKSFEPRKCTAPDCTSDRIFLTAQALEAHEMNNHRPITPPMRCTFEGCKSETLFGQWTSYTRHLKSIHGLASVKDRERYMLEEFKRVRPFQPQACPIGIGLSSCHSILFNGLSHLLRHLRAPNGHGLSMEEARKVARGIEPGQESGDASLFVEEDAEQTMV